MSEWRDFLESVELTDRQKLIYDLVCQLENPTDPRLHVADNLKHLLIEEFTGVKIV